MDISSGLDIPQSLLLSLQRPQQPAGGGEQVDGGRAVCDEGRLESQSLKQFDLEETNVMKKQCCTSAGLTGSRLVVHAPRDSMPSDGHMLMAAEA